MNKHWHLTFGKSLKASSIGPAQTNGVLVIDDSTLDKPYASKMALVTRHWSGKHKRVVQGVNLISLVWSDGDARLPCDLK